MAGAAAAQINAAFSSERRSITVPEWGDLTLYFPPVTYKRRQKAKDFARDSETGEVDTDELLLRLMLEMAEVEGDEKAFAQGDAVTLKTKADYMVVQRVINFMIGGGVLSKDGEKAARDAVEEDPTSDSN